MIADFTCRCVCSLAPTTVSGLADQPLSDATAPAKASKLIYYQNAGWYLMGALVQLRWSYTGGSHDSLYVFMLPSWLMYASLCLQVFTLSSVGYMIDNVALTDKNPELTLPFSLMNRRSSCLRPAITSIPNRWYWILQTWLQRLCSGVRYWSSANVGCFTGELRRRKVIQQSILHRIKNFERASIMYRTFAR